MLAESSSCSECVVTNGVLSCGWNDNVGGGPLTVGDGTSWCWRLAVPAMTDNMAPHCEGCSELKRRAECSDTRSQCRSCRSGIMWSYLQVLALRHAAAFTTDCTQSRSHCGRATNTRMSYIVCLLVCWRLSLKLKEAAGLKNQIMSNVQVKRDNLDSLQPKLSCVMQVSECCK